MIIILQFGNIYKNHAMEEIKKYFTDSYRKIFSFNIDNDSC